MFRVDPSKVSSAGVRARCSICGGIITIGAGTSIDEEFNEERVATPRATVTVADRAGADTPSFAAAAPDEASFRSTPAFAEAYESGIATFDGVTMRDETVSPEASQTLDEMVDIPSEAAAA